MKRGVENICAIFVTYYPDYVLLNRAICALQPQIGGVILVDNTPEGEEGAVHTISGVEVISLGQNLGIAAGHNKGISRARDLGYTHILLMDQDSVAAEDMVEHLFNATKKLCADGNNVAAVGPQIYDDREDRQHGEPAAFIDIAGRIVRRRYCIAKETLKVGHLISSGSLIPLAVIDQVGAMEEELFIDYVDIEWGLRARSKGFSSYAVCSAVLYHCLGDRTVRSSFFCHRRLQMYGSIRYFYQFRNAILLYQRKYIPWRWVFYNFSIHLCAKFFLYSFIFAPRLKNMMMMISGIWAGLRGEDGAYRGL